MSRDFHGGRTYSPDPVGGGAGIGFQVALAFAWLKSQLAELLALAGHAAEAADGEPIVFPANDDERDAELRLVSMFQVFDGPGGHPSTLGSPNGRRPAVSRPEQQDL